MRGQYGVSRAGEWTCLTIDVVLLDASISFYCRDTECCFSHIQLRWHSRSTYWLICSNKGHFVFFST